MIILMIFLSGRFGFYFDINSFHNFIPLTRKKLTKPTVNNKIVIELKGSILFMDPRFEYCNNPSFIIIESQIF